MAFVACSSFGSSDDPSSAGGADAGADGPGDLTGIAHAFDIALAGDASVTTSGDVTIPITITRGGAATGPSTISVRDLGDGLTAPDVIVQETEASTSLVITATAAALQGTRKITIVGRNPAANDQVEVPLSLLVRGPSGTLDLTWGVNGMAALPDTFDPLAMAVGSDDSLTVAGLAGAVGSARMPVLTRLRVDGSKEQSFNGGLQLSVPGPGGGDPVLRVDPSSGAGAVMFVSFSSGGTYLYRFEASGTADATVNSGGTAGLQQLDPTVSAEAAAQDLEGNWYTRAGSTLRRYGSNGGVDTGFGTQPLTGAGSPGFVRAGGNGIAIVWSALGAGVWRSTTSAAVRAGNTVSTATVDATGRSYLVESGKVSRYKAGSSDVDPSFTPVTLSTSFATTVPHTLTGLDDELFVYGGTQANIGGPVASSTILTKYAADGSVAKGFGAGGSVESLAGTFSTASLVRTKDGRIYAGRAATNGAGRWVMRYWP